MKRPPNSSIRVSLEMDMIAFFILAALSLLMVYLADPAIYAQSLSLTSSQLTAILSVGLHSFSA